ncbi:uncharacterized protein O3C94_014875 [Discoglossus pictus]
MALFNLFGSMFQIPETRAQNAAIYYSPKENLKGRPLKGKLRKVDIGSPTNFKHITHVGFNSVASLQSSSETDLKNLFSQAGIREEHLKDRELSRKIYNVIEKSGGMEAVQMEARRMTLVEKTNSPHYRPRSMSFSNVTPCKRPSSTPEISPHAAKIVANLSMSLSSGILSPIGSVPPPPATPPPFSDFPSMEPLPPPPPVPPRRGKKAPVQGSTLSNQDSLPSPPSPVQSSQMEPLNNPPMDCPSDLGNTAAPPPPPPPPPPPLPAFLKKTSGDVPAPPPPPPPPVSVPPPISQFKKVAQSVKPKKRETKIDEGDQMNDPSFFLTQIKQGVQLKSVAPVTRTDSTQGSTIVNALMDVIQKRHHAIQSSDEDDAEHEGDWD